MMVVDITTTPAFRAGVPQLLFEKLVAPSWDFDAKGKRFLMIKQPAVQQTETDRLNIVLNWFEELRRRVPVPSR